MEFKDRIINWYNKNKRDLPWRKIKDPYKIWLSEVILQQTRVNQGKNYYLNFISHYPNVRLLADAHEDEVLNLWKGLGYYSRARNLHKTAQIIYKEHKGQFPTSYNVILSLPGIGPYTAAAIMSFAYQQSYAVVDGNVFRVLSRYFGDKTEIDSSKGRKHFTEIADQLIDKMQPDDFNQAIMELGAVTCLPKRANCPSCPLNESCYAYLNKKVYDFPIKGKKIKKRTRYFYYLHIVNEHNIVMKKRKEKDIWQHLFDFPLIENKEEIKIENVIKEEAFQAIFKDTNYEITDVSAPIKHILTHQTIVARFIKITIKNSKNLQLKDNDLQWISLSDAKNIAIPRLIEKYLLDKA